MSPTWSDVRCLESLTTLELQVGKIAKKGFPCRTRVAFQRSRVRKSDKDSNLSISQCIGQTSTVKIKIGFSKSTSGLSWPLIPSLIMIPIFYFLNFDSIMVPTQVILKVSKGILHKKNQSPKSHILDNNGVSYSLFWSAGPKNHLNLTILVSKFVPGTSRGNAPGTSRGGAGVSRGSNFSLLFSSTFLHPLHQQSG